MSEHRVVLIAVNDLVEQAQLERTLQSAGYQVVVARDPGDVLLAAERHRPSVSILAHGYGGSFGGHRLCQHLKANPATRALGVLLLCGREDEIQPTDGTDGGADEVLVRPLLSQEILIRVATIERLIRYAQDAVQGSRIDPLTGTFNSSYLLDRLKHEVMRANRYGRSLAILVVDIDQFDKINQQEGSTSADLVLREVARSISSKLRGVDLVARTGGDDFTVVLPETSLLVARSIAERLREAVDAIRCTVVGENREFPVTVSIGIAGIPHLQINDAPSLLERARSAWIRSVEGGGNRSSF